MSVANLSTDNIKEFGGNALLTQFIIFKLKLLKQLFGIIVGTLHGHDSRSLLGSTVLREALLHACEEEHREHGVEYACGIRLKQVRTAGSFSCTEISRIKRQIPYHTTRLTPCGMIRHANQIDAVGSAVKEAAAKTGREILDRITVAF